MNDHIYFLILSIIPFLGFIGEYLFKRTKVHVSLWLITFGILISSFVNIEIFKKFSSLISGIALAFILFNSGININIRKFINVFSKGFLMAVINMFFSFIIIFLILVFLVKLNFENAMVISIILSGISSIVIIPLVEKIEVISEKTKIKLILESTLTDIFVIILSLSVYQYLVLGTGDFCESIKAVFSNFVIGMFVGIFFGVIYLKINDEVSKEEYPYVLTISFLFLSYFLSEFLGGNGGISSLFFGLVLGNGKHFSRIFFMREQEIDYLSKHIFGLMTFLIVSFFFVYMGLFFDLTDLKVILIGLVLSLFIFITRKVTVCLFCKYFGLKDFEINIVSCMFARGLSAGIMAFMFYSLGFLTFFEVNIIFSVILFTIILTTVAVKLVLTRNH